MTDAELKGIRDRFVEVGAAARDAGKASAEGSAAAAGGGKGAAAGGLGAAVGKIAKVGAIGLVAVGLEAVKMSNSFQTEMLKIRTEGGATSKEFRTMRHDVLQLALSGQSFGQGPTSLAQGLYHLESMGIRGKQAILGLKLASAEAAISGSNLQDTTTSLGGALFIAAKGTRGITGTMGALNAIAGAGNMRFQELNDALGTGLLGSAKIAGVSLQETGAALAVLTDSGYKASSAGAQLATALHYLYAPTSKAETALKSIGITHGKLATDLHKPQGLLVALRDLRAHMHGMSPNAQAQTLNSILPGGRGRVLLNLYQLQDRMAPKYGQIRGTENDFGKHMAEQAQNPTTKMHVAVAKLSAELVLLGDKLTKYVTPAFTFLVGVLAKLLGFLLAAFNWFTKMNPAAKALATFVGILAAAFALYTLKVIAAKIAQGLFNLVMDANPITLVIIAIAALAAGIVYAYNKSATFRKILGAVWDWMRTAATDTANWVVNAFHNVVAFFERLPGRIGHFFSGVASSIKGVFQDIVNGGIIGPLNWLIGQINSISVDVPLLGHVGFNIGKLGLLGASSHAPAKHSTAPAPGLSRPGHQPSGPVQATRAFAQTAAVPLKERPMLVTGDVVMKVRGREIGRVTRHELHNAMMG